MAIEAAKKNVSDTEANAGVLGTAGQLLKAGKESVVDAATAHPILAGAGALGAGVLGAGLAAKKYLASKKK